MTRICWWSVDLFCRALDPGERDAVRGDIAESGETGAQALRDVLGLVMRRQAYLWNGWKPWLGLLGIVLPFAVLLTLVSRRIAYGTAIPIWMYVNNWTWTYVSNAAFRLDLVHHAVAISMQYLALVCWSWTSGIALRALSRWAIPVNGAIFCVLLLFAGLTATPRVYGPGHAAVYSLTFYSAIMPLMVQMFLVVLPSLWGMHQGRRLATLPPPLRTILWIFVIVTMTALPMQHWFRWQILGAGWQTIFALAGPTGYIVATAIHRRWRSNPALS